MINFYEIIEFPDLICSKFYEGVFNSDLKGINIFILFELVFEVIFKFVNDDFKEIGIKLSDLPAITNHFLLDPTNY
jgi:hypothetical protein